tara:strand:+ start:450 stop:1001 length:552 start_codon:yes stop_codon:yes gene_type:complete
MKIKITIETGNAAFTFPENEVARILQVYAAKIIRLGGVSESALKDVDGNTVGKVEIEGKGGVGSPQALQEQRANAQLIAAAPELLDALKAARDLLASLPPEIEQLETMAAEDTACQIQEVIAKAEWVERDPLTGAQLADLEGPEQVHCLKCGHVYLEAEVCPKCGNADKQETVYLMPESRFKS